LPSGSEIIRAARTSSTVIGSRANASGLRPAQARADAVQVGGDTATKLLLPLDRDLGLRHRATFQSYTLAESRDGGALEIATYSYPGAAIAMYLSALFDHASPASPEAFSFSQAGRIERMDFFTDDPDAPDNNPAAEYNTQAYLRAVKRFRSWGLRNLVPSPARLERDVEARGTAPVVAAVLETSGRNGDRLIEVARNETSDPTEDYFAQLPDWARRTAQRLSPWADLAMLSVRRGGSADPDRAPFMVSDLGGSGRRPERTAVMARPAARQGQMIRPGIGAEGVEGVLAGYLPVAASPRLFASEDGFAPGGSTDGPRLTATGAEFDWALLGGDSPIYGRDRQPGDFWLADRLCVSYRPSREHVRPSNGGGDLNWQSELTFAMPQNYHASMPPALLPAPPGPVPLTGRSREPWQQFFAPGFARTARVSARAGVWATARLGIVQRDWPEPDGAQFPPTVAGSQTPVHIRLPRPPLLAANDRPRASSHEPGHFRLTDRPEVILHGPRVSRVGTALKPTGLNRDPRSLWAVTISRRHPARGLLPVGWDGTFELFEEALHGSLPSDGRPLWQLGRIVLRIGELAYEPQTRPAGGADLGLSGLAGAGFGEFHRSIEGGFVRLHEDLPLLEPGTGAVLELTLTHQAPGGPALIRQARFDLLVSGEGLHLVEAPVYFRFDDPEYNDRLDGLAKLDRRPLADAAGDEIVFAADRPDIRVSDRIEFGVGLRPEDPADTLGIGFGETDGKVSHAGQPVLLTLARRRSGQSGETALQDLSRSDFFSDAPPPHHWFPANADLADFLPFAVDCNELAAVGDSSDGPLLAVGDQLVVTLVTDAGDEAGELARLSFDIVARPLLPANPSAFAVLALRSAGDPLTPKRVSVPLYASGPPARSVELVDPRDLIDGLVRRRAIYQWRGFEQLTELLAQPSMLRFAVQKINSVGGSWLPPAVESDWLDYPEE